jgi:hypothetical protein
MELLLQLGHREWGFPSATECLSGLVPDRPINQVLPAELSAAAVLIDYWNKEINNAVWITMCLVVVIFINALGAGAYGEAEFIFASIKVRITSFSLSFAQTDAPYQVLTIVSIESVPRNHTRS